MFVVVYINMRKLMQWLPLIDESTCDNRYQYVKVYVMVAINVEVEVMGCYDTRNNR